MLDEILTPFCEENKLNWIKFYSFDVLFCLLLEVIWFNVLFFTVYVFLFQNYNRRKIKNEVNLVTNLITSCAKRIANQKQFLWFWSLLCFLHCLWIFGLNFQSGIIYNIEKCCTKFVCQETKSNAINFYI